jgi:hypothetical protein
MPLDESAQKLILDVCTQRARGKRLSFVIQPVQELLAFTHFGKGRFARERDGYVGQNANNFATVESDMARGNR